MYKTTAGQVLKRFSFNFLYPTLREVHKWQESIGQLNCSNRVNQSTIPVQEKLSYEGGVEASQTWSDYLVVEMEHGTFNLAGLDAFYERLSCKRSHEKADITRRQSSPHCRQTGLMSTSCARTLGWLNRCSQEVFTVSCCATQKTPGAVKVLVESARYPFYTIGVGKGLDVGRRGAGGQGSAAEIWGLSVEEYMRRADVWPLNPEGEIFLGLKIENKRALSNVEATARVPGIAFAEWGPGGIWHCHTVTSIGMIRPTQKRAQTRVHV